MEVFLLVTIDQLKTIPTFSCMSTTTRKERGVCVCVDLMGISYISENYFFTMYQLELLKNRL